MSVYSARKGWRYDFTLNGTRYTGAGFETKRDAKQAEAKRREELARPKEETVIPTDMAFLELVNRRLDHIQAYNSKRHYTDSIYYARRWTKQWGEFLVSEITAEKIEEYLMKRSSETSPYTANKELRYLRALFNFGLHPKRNWISSNPTAGISFFPVERRVRYVPPEADVRRVILAADPDTQDYLWTIALTLARVSEVNALRWDDVNLRDRSTILYTRKKAGGHMTPRKIPMTAQLFSIMERRFRNRDKTKPWVFWHRYRDRKNDTWAEGPYQDRKKFMKTLCRKAGVQYFRFHALRHFGASMLDQAGVPIGAIQRLLGHESRITTEIYLHSIGEAEREAMNVFESLLTEKSHTDSHTAEKKGLSQIS